MPIALALKYRPITFQELIAQESVTKTLSLALQSNRIAHAYLFSGLRGSGKTSSARIFARALQCEKAPISDPCNACDHCRQSLEGRHIDIIEMDAASSRKIDDIRNLIEQTHYGPSYGRYKIFIIDEVHMLTKEAFNALLKTLEEPPGYIKFILATTDPLKLPATILSRTQHFRFKKIPQKPLIKHLQKILEKEQIEYDEPSIEILARSGNGSVRDTLTLTDQAIAYCNKKLSAAQVTQMLGVIDPLVLRDFFSAIKQNDTARRDEILELFSEHEPEMLLDEMALYLKDCIKSAMNLSLLTLERYLRIIADSKNLLYLNCDGGFVMLLCALKMQEAQKFESLESEIKSLEKSLLHPASAATPPPAPMKSSAKPSLLDERFERLLAKLYDRNSQLGEIFSQCIQFVDFKDDILTWYSDAQGEQRDILSAHYSIIKQFVKEVFTPQTKIQQAPKNPAQPIQENTTQAPALQESPKIQQDPIQTPAALTPQESAKLFYEQNQAIIDALKQNIPITDVKKI